MKVMMLQGEKTNCCSKLSFWSLMNLCFSLRCCWLRPFRLNVLCEAQCKNVLPSMCIWNHNMTGRIQGLSIRRSSSTMNYGTKDCDTMGRDTRPSRNKGVPNTKGRPNTMNCTTGCTMNCTMGCNTMRPSNILSPSTRMNPSKAMMNLLLLRILPRNCPDKVNIPEHW